MIKRIVYSGLLCSMLSGVNCADKKLMIKSLPVRPGLKLNWYHYSYITNFSRDYVEIADLEKDREEVIFEASTSAICQIQVRSDSILILMFGNNILKRVDNNDYHFKIIVDTTCRGSYLYK